MALTGAAAAACGGEDDGGGGREAPRGSEAPSRVPPPTRPRPARPPAQPSDLVRPITVAGDLAEPAPGCTVVETTAGSWTLVGELPRGLRMGDRVEVTGRPAPEVETGCGHPALRIESIRAA